MDTLPLFAPEPALRPAPACGPSAEGGRAAGAVVAPARRCVDRAPPRAEAVPAAPWPGRPVTTGGPARAADAASAQPSTPLEALHPALWRAHQLGQQREATWPSGFAPLDAVLPGGGWPSRVLTELLLPHAGIGEVRLLAPALVALQQDGRSVMLFDPPALPYGAALGDCGLDLRQLYVVASREVQRGRARGPLPAADVLWALEQALRSGHLGAVLAWLPPRLPGDALRRLQLAAQAHDGPAFVLRDESARLRPSVAPLRLWLRAGGADELRLQVLKRRGPPLAQPLRLALPPVLSPSARRRARPARGQVLRFAEVAGVGAHEA